MTVEAKQFETVGEAMQDMDASGYGDEIISARGVRGYLLVTKAVADQLERANAVTAFWYWHEASQQIVSVPLD